MQTIFIQEPDDSIREILSLIIQQEGFRTNALADCPASIRHNFSLQLPALAMLDFKLGGENAISLCRTIKTYWPKLPVIAMSCNSNIKNLYRKYHFDAFLEKPFDIEHLISLIHQLIPARSKNISGTPKFA